jgi:hypothetical protein
MANRSPALVVVEVLTTNPKSAATKTDAQCGPCLRTASSGPVSSEYEGEQKVVYDFAAKLAKLDAFVVTGF